MAATITSPRAANESSTATASAIDQATDALRVASEQRITAQASLSDLLDQIDAGKPASGLGNLREQLEIAERVEAAKERALSKAREDHAGAIAQEIAREVAKTLGRDGSPTLVGDAEKEAVTRLAEALSLIPSAIEQRDTTCDEAGARLHEAGVPTGATIGRISYGPVRTGVSGRPLAGHWNVRVDGVAYSQRHDHGHSKKEALNLTQKALVEALRSVGLNLNGTISQL